MTKRRRTLTARLSLLAVLGALVLVAAAPQGQAGGGTAITTCGQTVTTNSYLTQDLYCPGSAGVVVGASGITIDLKGFTLRGDRSDGSKGIDDTAGFDHVAVKNGAARNFGFGVYLNDADAARIMGVLASGNLADGIQVSGASVSVTSSAGYGNGNFGIYAIGDHATIKSSIGAGNAGYGIQVVGDFARVASSQASGNRFDGLAIIGDSASVKSSTASGNYFSGVLVNSNAATISGNRVYGNGFYEGDSDLAGVGVYVTYGTTPPAGKNVARGNDDPAECSPASLC